MQTPTHEQIASLAYQFWQQRGCPEGSPEVDWERAMQVLEQPPDDNAIVGFADARFDAEGMEEPPQVKESVEQGRQRQGSARKPSRPSA